MSPGTHDALTDERNDGVLIYVDGEFAPRNEAKVSVFDSAFLVGDGIWEGFRLHKDTLIHFERHLDRLFSTAKGVGLEIGKTREELGDLVRETVMRNNMHTDVHIRLMISRGRKKTPAQHPKLVIGDPTIVIIAEHKKADPEVTARGITLATSTIRRPPPDTLDQRWNCHSKIHEVAALVEAERAGADEALMLDTSGNVATCNATNFFIVVGPQVWTSTGMHCLNGITRSVVIELCREGGIPVFERDFRLDDVYAADEAFVTGSFGGLTPVTTIDGHTIGSGERPMTLRLRDMYSRSIEAEATR